MDLAGHLRSAAGRQSAAAGALWEHIEASKPGKPDSN